LAPEFIDEKNIKTVIITVTRKKAEIMDQLSAFSCISRVYLPAVHKTDRNQGIFKLNQI
jgi:RecB family endonuclease NucS